MEKSRSLAALERRLNYSFLNRNLLLTAVTHRSYLHDARGLGAGTQDYQALEFLGDAVVGFLVSEHLFRRFPDKREGELSKIRASLVSREALARKAAALGLGDFARLSRGEEKSGGRDKKAILADLFESVTAAVYLDGGVQAARDFLMFELQETLNQIERDGYTHSDFKSMLQEAAHRLGKQGPVYQLVGEEGPPHERRFFTNVHVGEDAVARGSGTSKKASEQAAAQTALRLLEESSGTGELGKEIDQENDHDVE